MAQSFVITGTPTTNAANKLLTGAQILDAAMTLSIDQSAAMRTKMLAWLQLVISDLTTRRKWLFLNQKVSLVVSNNRVLLPNDFLELVSVEYTDNIIRTAEVDGQYLTFDPLVQNGETVTVVYEPVVSSISDNSDVTVLPYYSKTALMMGIISYLYVFDRDPEFSMYPQLYEQQILNLKVLDNRNKPMPEYPVYLAPRWKQWV
jgi:hypothetical protein